MRHATGGALVVALASLTAAFAGDTAPVSTATVTVPKDAWAVVDSSVVTKAEVEKRAKLLAILFGVPEVPTSAALEAVVGERAIALHLDREGVGPGSVTAQDLADARKEMVAQSPSASAELDKRVHDAGLDLDFDAELRVGVAFRKLVEKSATDAALRESFERHKVELCDGEVRARSLLVAPVNGDALAFARAQQLLSATKADGSNLEQLCRALSDDPNAPLTGGDLDFFGPASPWVPREVRAACFEQGRVGLVPSPVKAHDGYHILYVTATRIFGDPSFESHKDKVKLVYLMEKQRELATKWHDEAKIVFAADAPRERAP